MQTRGGHYSSPKRPANGIYSISRVLRTYHLLNRLLVDAENKPLRNMLQPPLKQYNVVHHCHRADQTKLNGSMKTNAFKRFAFHKPRQTKRTN